MNELVGGLVGGGNGVVELFKTITGDVQLTLTASTSLSLVGMLEAVQTIPGFEIVRGTKEGDATASTLTCMGFLLCKPSIIAKGGFHLSMVGIHNGVREYYSITIPSLSLHKSQSREFSKSLSSE